MPTYSQPITDLIQKRFSCRKYSKASISVEMREKLREYMTHLCIGPFGTPMRFDLITADDQDGKALRGLGTYGFIQGASGFVVGALGAGQQNLEEYGYRMEQIVLAATDLGLGTCWLGGTFTKSTFARRIELQDDERMPAILAIGVIQDENSARNGVMRQYVAGQRRIPWEELFFDRLWGKGLSPEVAGEYSRPLEMVRLGPSASNKQPWRIVQTDGFFHFFIQRTKGYRNLLTRLVQVDDMQRLDMGIAMCHFELTARELGLKGKWGIVDHGLDLPDDQIEYSVSWVLTS
ncbi:MAG: nitroreductase family protein [Anaerolineaceae bacterium]|nr:nitroreductase family protein [Anaerolineaceae bacterium]